MVTNKKIYFDTNIVLDIIDSTRKHHNNAKKLWELSTIKHYKIMISEDMLSTVFYINKDQKYTLKIFKIFLKRWEIVPFGKDVIRRAIELSLNKNLDLEDVLQCLCAKENGCQVLITNDKKFHDCGIEILTAETFLKKYETV